jgi:hypothetical protein
MAMADFGAQCVNERPDPFAILWAPVIFLCCGRLLQ